MASTVARCDVAVVAGGIVFVVARGVVCTETCRSDTVVGTQRHAMLRGGGGLRPGEWAHFRPSEVCPIMPRHVKVRSHLATCRFLALWACACPERFVPAHFALQGTQHPTNHSRQPKAKRKLHSRSLLVGIFPLVLVPTGAKSFLHQISHCEFRMFLTPQPPTPPPPPAEGKDSQEGQRQVASVQLAPPAADSNTTTRHANPPPLVCGGMPCGGRVRGARKWGSRCA